jgi:alanine racemase
MPVEEVASAAGTVSYELLCALAPRVPVVEVD